MARRLSNVKTIKEAALNYVIDELQIDTPFGKEIIKKKQPYYPGQEEELRNELHKIQMLYDFIKDEPEHFKKMQIDGLMCMNDPSFSIERSGKDVLSVVELFEIKRLLLLMHVTRNYAIEARNPIPADYIPNDIEDVLDIVDPRKDRLQTFYIYEEFSEKLLNLRKEKRDLEKKLRKEQKAQREIVRKEFGVELTPKFDCIIPRSNEQLLEKVNNIELLEVSDQDYLNITFSLKKNEEGYRIAKAMEDIATQIEEEEYKVREVLSKKIWENHERIFENCHRIGLLEMNLAKAEYAIKTDCVCPNISDDHVISFVDARHLKVEAVMKKKKQVYMPISIDLKQGVTCITGANMGGKTISLKLIGLVALLAQYGFFVPCKEATVGLSNYIQMLIGDSQSVERGLSSFGSEMEELKEILDKGTDRSVILIDEIASGTNPTEGLALSKSLIDYLKEKPYISTITTHFDAVNQDDIVNLQVVGLANADFDLLKREISYANRAGRIQVIGKYMDYRLCRIEGGGSIPKDALNIALMLGIDEDIINRAKEYLM